MVYHTWLDGSNHSVVFIDEFHVTFSQKEEPFARIIDLIQYIAY